MLSLPPHSHRWGLSFVVPVVPLTVGVEGHSGDFVYPSRELLLVLRAEVVVVRLARPTAIGAALRTGGLCVDSGAFWGIL